MYILVQPTPVFTGKVPVRLVPVLHAALPARARRGDGVRCFCAGFKGLRVKGASPGVELYCLHTMEGRRRRAMAVFVPLEARPGQRGGLVNIAATLHAAARRGRGEAAGAEPGRGARVLAFCLRAGVGVRAAHAVFFVTLGTVSSSDWTCPEVLELRTRAEFTAGLLRALSTVTLHSS